MSVVDLIDLRGCDLDAFAVRSDLGHLASCDSVSGLSLVCEDGDYGCGCVKPASQITYSIPRKPL